MHKLTSQDPEAQSLDLVADNIAKLTALFPEILTEGADGNKRVDWEALRELLGESVEDKEERYQFTWHGKAQARRLAQTPSLGTLRPCVAESKRWNNTQNLFIEGDNLEVLKLLQKSYHQRVKMIYIDPPYNTGKDFIYPDNYRDNIANYLELTGQSDGGRKMGTNTETSGRYHTNWLNMMYPRLKLARNLLRDDGVIFISIDDTEVANLRKLCDEIFGEENFVSVIVIQSNKRGQTYKDIAKTHEYLLVYGKSDEMEIGELEKGDDSLPYQDSKGKYDLWELRNRNPKFGRHNRPNLYFPVYICPEELDEIGYAKISTEKSNKFRIAAFPKNSEGVDSCWRWSQKKINASDITSQAPIVVAKQKRDGEWNIYEKSRKNTTKAKTIWDDISVISEQGTTQLGELGLKGIFDHPKPVDLIKKTLQISTKDDDLLLDFFSGSAATAHAVMALNAEDSGNRKFIMVQLPEPTDKPDYPTIADIGKERIRRAGDKILADKGGIINLDVGFKVFKLDSTNIKPWDVAFDTLEQDILTYADSIKSDRSAEDVLYEILLKYGLDLSLPISTHTLAGKTVYSIGGVLVVCLDHAITLETVEAIAKLKAEWQPETAMRVVFRDSGFADDVVKVNAVQILKQAGIDDVRSV